MTPAVSICMPHLNSQPFTRPRMDSIVQQTLPDWELIIVDSNSDDGSREILEQYARGDSRIRIEHGPRDGIYTNINRAIEMASGKYVYIATSDDTMAPECLERMVSILEQHPDCGLCQSGLEIVDADGRAEIKDAWENWRRQKQCFGQWLKIPHVRRAPHDGIMHLGLGTVYGSLTQLLIRKRVFDELGLFRTDYSPHADFEWGMRVGLNENIVYLPAKLASWRRHDRQATQLNGQLGMIARGEFRRLTQFALAAHKARNPSLVKALKRSRLQHFYLVDEFSMRRRSTDSKAKRLLRMAGFVGKHPRFSLQWLFHKCFRTGGLVEDFAQAVEKEFAKLGLRDLREQVREQSPAVPQPSAATR